jgi:hypothetical protein
MELYFAQGRMTEREWQGVEGSASLFKAIGCLCDKRCYYFVLNTQELVAGYRATWERC